MDRVRTFQLNGHSRSRSFSAIIVVTIIMMAITNTNLVISLDIPSKVMKSDFFVTRATSKTLKVLFSYNHLAPETHLNFTGN